MNKFKILIIPLVMVVLVLSGCKTPEEPAPVALDPLVVKGQTVADSHKASQVVSYPGLVAAASEATVSAKASGNLVDLNVRVGDQVDRGQVLARIDDATATLSNNRSSFNANQVKQAEIAVSSAEATYNLARENYNNILISSVKDLRAAEIARDQAAKNESNLVITSADSLKSAELAYQTAKLATQQAASSLENRQKSADQTLKDTQTNARLSASAVVATAGSVITSINNATGFDENNNVSISYRSNLGALDSSTYETAKQAYRSAKDIYNDNQNQPEGSVEEEVTEAIKVVEAVKQAADSFKALMDKSTSSVNLPQSSPGGVSLSGLQSAASGYQSQINAALSQISGFKQALSSVVLNNDTMLDGLRQALAISQQQEASAKQNLNNLKSGSNSQQNQAAFTSSLAQNQFDNARVKIETQVASAKTQMETAKLQYNNALVSLDSLYDAYSVVSPLDGTVTKIFVAQDQSVGPGQPIITISQVDGLKIQFYIESSGLNDIKSGLSATIIDRDGHRLAGLVSAVSPQADSLTRRFLVEVELVEKSNLVLGTVVDVSLDLQTVASDEQSLVLPLEAITIGQNGNHIFIAADGIAHQVPVEILEVKGEIARIKADLAEQDIVIISGNRRLEEGQAVSLE